MNNEFLNIIKNFRLPRYDEVPNLGLFLEQAKDYVNKTLNPLFDFSLTTNMISNYVKSKLINNPVGKKYNRDHLCYIIALTMLKNVLSLDNLDDMYKYQKANYANDIGYDYFCNEFENILKYVFGITNKLEKIGGPITKTKLIFRSAIYSLVYKIYVIKNLD